MNARQTAERRAPAPRLLAEFLMLAGCMNDCHGCGEPMAPGDFIGTWSDGTVRHEHCAPWTPVVIDGDGDNDGQGTLPLLTVIDGECR